MLEAALQELRPIRRREYEQMALGGMFEDERVELLYGSIVCMSPIGPPHDTTVQRLNRIFMRLFDRPTDPRAIIRIQGSFAASDHSEPQPDVAVVPPADYYEAHPDRAWLIVEVAESSRNVDKGTKARLYAESGVPEYWVVDLVSNLIEVHTDIVGGEYTRITPYRKGERIALVHFHDATVDAADVLR